MAAKVRFKKGGNNCTGTLPSDLSPRRSHNGEQLDQCHQDWFRHTARFISSKIRNPSDPDYPGSEQKETVSEGTEPILLGESIPDAFHQVVQLIRFLLGDAGSGINAVIGECRLQFYYFGIYRLNGSIMLV